jgi:hypothetical protein
MQNSEMSIKVFEETEYTITLYYMEDRYKRMMLWKQQPLQNKLKAFEFVMSEIYRWRNKTNIFKLSITQEIQPVHKNMTVLKKELLSIRRFQKLKDVAKERRDELKQESKGNLIHIMQ